MLTLTMTFTMTPEFAVAGRSAEVGGSSVTPESAAFVETAPAEAIAIARVNASGRRPMDAACRIDRSRLRVAGGGFRFGRGDVDSPRGKLADRIVVLRSKRTG